MYVKPYNPFSGESRQQSRLITFQTVEGKTIIAKAGNDQPQDFIVLQPACLFIMTGKPRDEELVAEYRDNRNVIKKPKPTRMKIWIVFVLVEIIVLYLQLRLLNLI